jgi:hypothetical protein
MAPLPVVEVSPVLLRDTRQNTPFKVRTSLTVVQTTVIEGLDLPRLPRKTSAEMPRHRPRHEDPVLVWELLDNLVSYYEQDAGKKLAEFLKELA